MSGDVLLQAVVSASAAVIAHNQARLSKHPFTANPPGAAVCHLSAASADQEAVLVAAAICHLTQHGAAQLDAHGGALMAPPAPRDGQSLGAGQEGVRGCSEAGALRGGTDAETIALARTKQAATGAASVPLAHVFAGNSAQVTCTQPAQPLPSSTAMAVPCTTAPHPPPPIPPQLATILAALSDPTTTAPTSAPTTPPPAPYNSIAVLYRRRAIGRPLQGLFLRHGIPFNVHAPAPHRRGPVRDVYALLRLVADGADLAASRRLMRSYLKVSRIRALSRAPCG